MNSSALKALGVAELVLAILVVGGVLSFAGPCVHEDGSAGACASASWGIIGAGVVLAGSALALLVVESKGARIACAVAAALLGLFIAFAPGSALPLCMMETMHCRAVMQPFALVCGVIAALVAIVAAIAAARMR